MNARLRLLPPLLLSLCPLLVVAGCKSRVATPNAVTGDAGPTSTENTPAPPSAPRSAAVDPATVGTVQGVVRFDGKAPERIKIDMSMDPACSFAGDNLTEQYVVKDGKLANVYLYLKNAPASTAAPGTPTVLLDQKGCRFIPHVIAVQQGGAVEFRNSDMTMHNVHITPNMSGNKTIDVSEGPRGAPETRRFDGVETMLPVRCNNHPWMQAFLNVAPSPYFAVSAADGSFTIRNIPAGTYTLAAVHEKMGEQDTQITVKPQQTGKAEITFATAKSR